MKRSFLLVVFLYCLFSFSACDVKNEGSAKRKRPDKDTSVEFSAQPREIPMQDVRPLPIGARAPDFSLPAIDGKWYSLDDFKDAEVLVVIFTCNHCPTSQAYEDRIIKLVQDYQNQSVRIIAISPNSVKAILLEDLGYSDLGDSFEEMKVRALNKGFNFLYLYDGDTQETSIEFGPDATPQAFVFDRNRRLRYRGRLDDSEQPGTAYANDLRSSIDAVLLDVDLLEPIKKSFGCPIRWAWESQKIKKVNEDWNMLPVTISELNERGVRQLMRNGSNRLWLINIWATWCGPCVIEYPSFIEMHRMFIGRDFEFISLSSDKLIQKEKALNFLKEKNSSVRNYIFSGSNMHNLINIVDPQWDGLQPYTILIEPGGQVVYKKIGTINPLELKKIIVDHPMIGRYL